MQAYPAGETRILETGCRPYAIAGPVASPRPSTQPRRAHCSAEDGRWSGTVILRGHWVDVPRVVPNPKRSPEAINPLNCDQEPFDSCGLTKPVEKLSPNLSRSPSTFSPESPTFSPGGGIYWGLLCVVPSTGAFSTPWRGLDLGMACRQGGGLLPSGGLSVGPI